MKFSNVRGFLDRVAKCDMISFTHKDYIFVSSALQPSFQSLSELSLFISSLSSFSQSSCWINVRCPEVVARRGNLGCKLKVHLICFKMFSSNRITLFR